MVAMYILLHFYLTMRICIGSLCLCALYNCQRQEIQCMLKIITLVRPASRWQGCFVQQGGP